MSVPSVNKTRYTKRAPPDFESFDNSLLDIESEQFVPLKDHIYLIDATAGQKGSRLGVGVEVETSLVSSPARVIKHVEYDKSQSKGETDLPMQPLNVVSSYSDVPRSEGNSVPMPLKASRELNFEQCTQMPQKTQHPDDIINKLKAKRRGGGTTQSISSRYLQPRQGPLKAMNRNMDALKNIVQSSAGSKGKIQTKQSGNLKKSISSSSSNLTLLSGKSLAKSQSFLNTTKVKPSSVLEDRKGNSSDLSVPRLSFQRQSAKVPRISSNLGTPEKNANPSQTEMLASSTKVPPRGDSLLVEGKVQVSEPSFKTGRTSTPNNQGTRNMSYYAVDISSIEPSALTIASDSQQLHNKITSEGNLKKMDQVKPKLTDELLIEVLYSRYLQYIYLDASAEKSAAEAELQAITQIFQMKDLALKTGLKRREAEMTCQLKQQKLMMTELANILDNQMTRLLPKLESAVDNYDNLANAIDETRNYMETSGIYFPDKSTEEGTAYYKELMDELLESESILKEMAELTEDHEQDLTDASGTMARMADISKECIMEMERSKALLEDMSRLTLKESMLKVLLANNNNNDDERLKSRYFKF